MDPTVAARRLAKEQYTAMRQALALLDRRVMARYWPEESPVRAGYQRFLGSLDEAAGRLLADDEISQRGHDLLHRTGGQRATPEPPADDADAWAAAAQEPPAPPVPVEPPAPPVPVDTPAPPVPVETPPPPVPAGTPGTVDVTFTLPADVVAESVALSGEFNDWSTSDIFLERGGDGTWRATVPLEPGRSYRYRYLVDGERWENAWDADRYEPNSFGSVDSVVEVERPAAAP